MKSIHSPTWFTALTTLTALSLLPCMGCPLEAPPDPDLGQIHHGIIGGEETREWEAVGGYLSGWLPSTGFDKMCTATLVTPDVAVTAAHCWEGTYGSDYFFEGYNVHMYDWLSLHAVETIPHPDYDPSTHDHDIAVLLFDEPREDIPCVGFNLDPVGDDWLGELLHYVGFGVDTHYGATGDHTGGGTKRETDIELVDYDELRLHHESEGTNTCSGDSGGPALTQRSGEWRLAGISSIVYTTDDSQDEPCEGGGAEARVDIHLDFLAQYVDLDAVPCTGVTEAVGDDDDDDDGGEGCQCRLQDASNPGGPLALLALAAACLGARGVRRRLGG